MPGEGTQKLTLEVREKGAEQTAKDVGKVGKATDDLQAKTKQQATETTKAAAAQQDLNAAETDYITLLTQIDPRLGQMADGMLKGGKIAGDFATAQINLGDAVQTVTGAIAANANTLKLLGAAGGVVVGFTAVYKVINLVREGSKKLREELRELRAEATTEEEQRLAGAGEVTRLARGRRERGFSAAEEVEAQRIYGMGARGGGFDAQQMALFQQNLAALVGLLSGPEIETLTRAGVSIGLEAPAERREREARRALGRPDIQEAAKREEIRVEAARGRVAAEALKELRADDVLEGLANLNKMMEEVAGGLDEEAVRDLAARALRIRDQYNAIMEAYKRTGEADIYGLPKGLEAVPYLGPFGGGGAQAKGMADFLRAARYERAPFLSGWAGEGAFSSSGGTPAQVQAAGRLIEVLERLADSIDKGEMNTVNEYHHAKFVGPDAESRQRRTRNGENEAVRIAG